MDEWTVGKLLQWTTTYLGDHGSDTARLDAEVLLAHARGCGRIDLYTSYEEVVDDASRTSFRELVRRRSSGAPVAYLVGKREFYSLPFEVNAEVLIPRPETELIVVAALDWIKAAALDRPRVVDVGVGSGAIAVSIAKYAPHCQFVACDNSVAALEVAKRNAVANGVGENVEFVESDLLAEVAGPFDLIVSNPPYVAEAEFAELPETVREFEPRRALVGGPTGVEVIARLAPQAADKLAPGGRLLVELSPMIAEQCQQLFAGGDDWADVRIERDGAQLPRMLRATRAPCQG
ncbi:MAG: peptide chain release factor N(5)-glutamine methyltransferase [Pirellulaceae bacterium]|jgi:release factor glutamine methyltransferase|nr:peptide chain release factor N(5)-glutamine methyltransferase [Pirellulaceae bacterium]MDP7015643.1 peptide chain release factor N(5)-glutamine methyltransferase [Pirellulaceae bacterium]